MNYTDTWTNGHGTVQYFTRSDGSRLRYFTAGAGPAGAVPEEKNSLKYALAASKVASGVA